MGQIILSDVVLTDKSLVSALGGLMWAYVWAVANTVSAVCRWNDTVVAKAAGVERTTAMRWRQRLVEAGLVRELCRDGSEVRLPVAHLPAQQAPAKTATLTKPTAEPPNANPHRGPAARAPLVRCVRPGHRAWRVAGIDPVGAGYQSR